MQVNRVIIVLPFVLVAWLVYRNIVPTGKLHIHFNANQTESAAIKNFAASEPDVVLGRDTKTGESYRLITQDLVSFDVKVPKPFKQATVRVTYQNPQGQTDLAVGAVQKAGGYYFREAAQYNESLEKLPSYWQKTRSGDLVLYQRDGLLADLRSQLDELHQTTDQNTIDHTNEIEALEDQIANHSFTPIYADIAQFTHQLPDPKKIVAYNYDLTGSVLLPDYQPANQETTTAHTLRGSHEFYTYIKNESLVMNFALQELNRKAGVDNAKIEVFHGDDKVFSEAIADDGNTDADGSASLVTTTRINLPNLTEGVYRVAYTTKDDETLIRSITTRQKYLVFIGHVYLADNAEYSFAGVNEQPTTVYTDSKEISLSTAHVNGLQEVRFGSQSGKIDKIKQNLRLEKTTQNALETIILPRNDVTISGRYFSFTPEQYFDPRMGSKDFAEVSAGQLDNYDYIIGNYPIAQIEGEWLVASQTVTVPQLYTEKGTIRMALNAPELKNNRRVLKLKSIDIDLERDPITLTKVIDKLRSKLHF
jgi:hypothetical protein